MKNKIKTLLEAYKAERYNQITQHLVNPKTGITPAERLRLLNYPPFTEGVADFFGKPFHFSDSGGFIHSIEEIFNQEIYKFTSNREKPYIIDCGANMGASIYYFKKLYPNAEILAFEPAENTFNILQKNMSLFGKNVEIRKEAVWIEDTELTFFSEGSLAGSLVVDLAKRNKTIKVKAINFKKYLNREIDFLKIDIEGAENKLIFDIEDYLHNVKNLFLEYHGIIGEKQNLGDILNLLSSKGFQYYIRLAGETIKHPFCGEKPSGFNQQLNILCYRN